MHLPARSSSYHHHYSSPLRPPFNANVTPSPHNLLCASLPPSPFPIHHSTSIHHPPITQRPLCTQRTRADFTHSLTHSLTPPNPLFHLSSHNTTNIRNTTHPPPFPLLAPISANNHHLPHYHTIYRGNARVRSSSNWGCA